MIFHQKSLKAEYQEPRNKHTRTVEILSRKNSRILFNGGREIFIKPTLVCSSMFTVWNERSLWVLGGFLGPAFEGVEKTADFSLTGDFNCCASFSNAACLAKKAAW